MSNSDNTNGRKRWWADEHALDFGGPERGGLFSWFTSRFGGNGDTTELRIRLEKAEKGGTSDGSGGNYRREPAAYNYRLWSLGWTDGRLGQPPETNEAILRARYRLDWLEKVESAETSLSRNKASAKQIGEALDRLRPKLHLARIHFDELWEKRSHQYREFSYILAGIYLLVALVLFLSDVPLSLKLVARGFDLKTEVRDSVTNNVVIAVDDLLRRPGAVISYLWEPLILALGIAFAGIFVKFFWDEVIMKREKDNEPRRITIALWITLILFVVTLAFLGVFRAKIQSSLQRSEFVARKAQVELDLRQQRVADREIERILTSMVTPPEESAFAIATFTLLTITLPVIGGICFSAGWRRLKNAMQYTGVKRELKRLEARESADAESLAQAEAGIRSQEQWVEHLEKERRLGDPAAELAVNLYYHGYDRGTNVPETMEEGEDLYVRALRAVEKITAKKFRHRIWEDVDERVPEIAENHE